ncbi:MAG: hypothetical protein ACYC3X_30075 [Pirellulaceae bacterium]
MPEEILKCVCFCGYEKKCSGRHLNGTAFMAAVQVDDRTFFYLITARHVIETVRDKGVDGHVYLRLNAAEDREDDSTWLSTELHEWTFHSDDRIDVAVCALKGWSREFDHKFYSLKACATEDVIRKSDIGIGDQLFFPGLFVRHPGERRNEPIVRFGRIAAMPSSPVKTKLGMAKVYLAESRSIGGFSGSPVFVYIPTDRDAPKKPFGPNTTIPLGGGETYLLGMIHGHFGEMSAAEDDAVPYDPAIDGIKVNMGIAVVVPVSSILEAISSPSVVDHCESVKKQHIERNGPVAESETDGPSPGQR